MKSAAVMGSNPGAGVGRGAHFRMRDERSTRRKAI